MSSSKRAKVDQDTSSNSSASTTPVEDIATDSSAKPPIQQFFEILPAQLVLEVFGWLRPFELLSLIETNRHIRKILTKKSAAHIWRRSRLNLHCIEVPLPDPPPHISEIRYTRALFDIHCHYCGEEGHGYEMNGDLGPVDFARFLRVCEECQETYYTPADAPFEDFDLPDWYDESELLKALRSVALRYPDTVYQGKFLNSDLKKHIPELLTLRRDVLDKKAGAEAAEAAYIAAGKAHTQSFADTCLHWECEEVTLGELLYHLDQFREIEIENSSFSALGYDSMKVSFSQWRGYYDRAMDGRGALNLWGPEVEDVEFLRKADERVRPIVEEAMCEKEKKRLAGAAERCQAGRAKESSRAAPVVQEIVYRCNHCPGQTSRLFSLEGLKSHSKAKHRLTEVAPADYTKVY